MMDFSLSPNDSFLLTVAVVAIIMIVVSRRMTNRYRRKNYGFNLSGPEEEGRINPVNVERINADSVILGFERPYNHVHFSAKGLTDRGLVRENNEDSLLIEGNPINRGIYSAPLFCAVADGMGGKDYGEVASSRAVEALQDEYYHLAGQIHADFDLGEWLLKTIQKANQTIIEQSEEIKSEGAMGTTLVAAVMSGKKAILANVGDSRAYLLRDSELRQITKDHSLVSLLVEKELIKPEEIYTHPRRGEIMRFLGQDGDLVVDLFELDIVAGDTLLLCSDGLWEMVRDPVIRTILEESHNLAEACTKLIDAANQAGGKDNISAVVIKVE